MRSTVSVVSADATIMLESILTSPTGLIRSKTALSTIISICDELLLEALNALKPIKIITSTQTTNISFVEPVVP